MYKTEGKIFSICKGCKKLMLKNDKNSLIENDRNVGNPPLLVGSNVFRLVKQSKNSPLINPVEMKLPERVKTGKNISTTPAVVGKGRVDAGLQGNMEVSI